MSSNLTYCASYRGLFDTLKHGAGDNGQLKVDIIPWYLQPMQKKKKKIKQPRQIELKLVARLASYDIIVGRMCEGGNNCEVERGC